MKDIHFLFDTPLGPLTIIENDYRAAERLRAAAILVSHSEHEPFSRISPLQYSRLLLKATAFKSEGDNLTRDQLQSLNDDVITQFAISYAKAINLNAKDKDALVALHEIAKKSEHFYQSKADKIKSPFSLSTTLASLHTTEQPVEDIIRHYWDNNKEADHIPTSKKLTNLLSVKNSMEQKEREKEKDIIHLDDLYNILIEQNDSQFKRDFETKKTVNRSFRLAIISLIVGLSNLALNLARYIAACFTSL